MEFVEVKELPKKGPRCEYKSMAPKLYEFLEMNVKCAKMVFDPYEYINVASAYATINTLAKYHRLPLKAILINGEVYVVRTDMEKQL